MALLNRDRCGKGAIVEGDTEAGDAKVGLSFEFCLTDHWWAMRRGVAVAFESGSEAGVYGGMYERAKGH